MVKTEKYKDEVTSITNYCKELNSEIGNYQKHYLTSDLSFKVELDNGLLKIPVHLVVNLNKSDLSRTENLIQKVTESFQPFQRKQKSYKKILSDWRRLFSSKGQ